MKTSPEITELAKALVEAQSEIGTAKKDAENKFFNNAKYATLASAWAAWQEVGPKNGLCVVQAMGSDDEASIVTTRLCHSSGQWMEGELRLKLPKEDMQGMGSAITYARRYSLMAMVGIAPADDDDGNAAVQSGAGAAPKQETAKRKTIAAVKDSGEWDEMVKRLEAATDVTHLELVANEIRDKIVDWPKTLQAELKDVRERVRIEIVGDADDEMPDDIKEQLTNPLAAG